jgi:hypothetical protein
MANKTVTVRPSGGTYTTLAAAIAGEVTANANLTAAGMNGILTISIEGTWSSADTDYTDITGFVVDSTHYLVITTDAANKAGTVWDTSKYRYDISGRAWDFAMGVSVAYTRIQGLQLRHTIVSTEGVLRLQDTGQIVDGCLIANGNAGAGAIILASSNGLARNCIIANMGTGDGAGNGINIANPSSGSRAQNCVTVNCAGAGLLVEPSASGCVVQNHYSGGNSGADYSGAYGTLTTCYSEDGTRSTSTAAYSTSTFTNVTDGSENLSLVSGSGLIGVGTDLRADASWPFDYDIAGTTRGSTWDVGAFEYVASATGNPWYYYAQQ